MSMNNGIASRESRGGTRTSTTAPRKTSHRRQTKAARASRRSLAAKARRNLQQAGMSLRDTVMDYEERGERQAHAAVGALKRFIRNEPLKSALICTSLALAAGAGLLAGRFLQRRDLRKLLKQYEH